MPNPLPSTPARSVALGPGPHRLVRSGIARPSRSHFPTRSGVGWSRAPRCQSPRRRLLMPKAASRNTPCLASRFQTTRTRENYVTGAQRACDQQRAKAIGERWEGEGGAFSSNQKARGSQISCVRLRSIKSRESGLAGSVTMETIGLVCTLPGSSIVSRVD